MAHFISSIGEVVGWSQVLGMQERKKEDKLRCFSISTKYKCPGAMPGDSD
jgi:hypothetical protein